MKYLEFIGKMVSYDRLNCSVNGNPAYHAIFADDNGNTLEGRTKSDAACGYGFLNYQYDYRKIRYHVTRGGNIRFDYVDPIRGNAVSDGLKLIPKIRKIAGNRENKILDDIAEIEEIRNDSNYHVFRYAERYNHNNFEFEAISGRITG